MPFKLRTEQAIRYFYYGFIVSNIAFIFMGILVIAMFSALANNPDEFEEGWSTIVVWAPVDWFVIGILTGYFILFAALIFYVPGLFLFNGGKWEFGPFHLSYSRKGIIFVIIGTLISIFGGFNFCLIGPFIGIVAGILISLGLMFLIVEIADEKGKTILKAASILFILVSIIAALANLWFFFSIFSPEGIILSNDMDFFVWGEVIPIAINVFLIIPISLFFLAYRRTYLRIKNKEILPIFPLPPMMPHPMVPPPYPPNFPRDPRYQGHEPSQVPHERIASSPIGIKSMKQTENNGQEDND